jgi:DNA-binding response OmpR family regulator
MRVLIVEDEFVTANFIREILLDHGHQVIGIAHNEATAWSHASDGADIAFVDMFLSDGETGAHIARGLRDLFNMPTIFVSGSAEQCRRSAKDSGAMGCLHKPFSEGELLATIDVAAALMSGHLPHDPPAGLELYHYVV